MRYVVWLKEPAVNELDCHSCNPPSTYETRTVGSK
jgi:hypothetical protein